MRSSLHVVITLNLNCQQTHLHHLRELIYMFQTLNREPLSLNTNAHRYSCICSCSKEKTSASNAYWVNSDGIESRSHSTLKWYTRTKLGSLLPFFQRTFVIISYLNDVPIFSFACTYWYSFHTWIEQSIDVYVVHFSEIFFCRGESTKLNATTESLLVWSKTCSASSVVGASSRRHSRLGPASSALYSLDDLILSSHDWVDVISENQLLVGLFTISTNILGPRELLQRVWTPDSCFPRRDT